MSTTTLERTTTATVAPPLTPAEQNSLLALAASTQKVERVRGGRTRFRSARAWSFRGDVD